jgi:endonuclease YncB( thermonuclease family)
MHLRFRLRFPLRAACLGLVVALLAVVPARAEVLSGPVAADVIRVIDGDTLALRARIWIGIDIVVNARIRGIDAPELRGRCDAEKVKAVEARARLEALADGRTVRLRRIENDKYAGRVLADIVTDEGTDLAAAMLESGLARPYDGSTRAPWCDVARLAD